MERGRLVEPELVVGDVAEEEAAGGGEALPALVLGHTEGFREELPGLGGLALTDQHAAELEEEHLLAARVAALLAGQRLAQDPLRFGVAPRQLGELGAQGGDGEEALRIVPREVEAALERGRELVQAPHAAGERQEDPEQIDLELRLAGALAKCGELLPQRGEELLARDLGRCRRGGEQGAGAGLGAAQQLVGGPELVHRARARREELAQPAAQRRRRPRRAGCRRTPCAAPETRTTRPSPHGPSASTTRPASRKAVFPLARRVLSAQGEGRGAQLAGRHRAVDLGEQAQRQYRAEPHRLGLGMREVAPAGLKTGLGALACR